MNRKRILIIGKIGQVGYELRRTVASLGEVSACEYPEIDLTKPDSILAALEKAKPNVIINAAAYTAVDKAESEVEIATKINSQAPGILAQYAKENHVLLVHYSTDYVFDGTGKVPYVETMPSKPLGVYGRTKDAADKAILASGCAHLIFRLCWVYGFRGHNFFLTMRRLAATREELRVVDDQYGCPTGARLIAEATAQALSQVLNSKTPEQYYGIYHLAANGVTSWCKFAQQIIDLMPVEQRKCQQVTPIATKDYPTASARPAYSALDCSKLERTFGIKLPAWQNVLELVTEELQQTQVENKK